jgi:hypothetical protein
LESAINKAIEGMRDFKIPSDKRESSWLCDDNKWIRTGYSFSIPVAKKLKGRQKPFGYISYQISFVGEGVGEVEEPLLHVSLWERKQNLTDDSGDYMGFPICDEGKESLNVADGRLLTWESGTDKYPFIWTYSVKLMSITDMNAIKMLAVNPVIELLKLHEVVDRKEWESSALEKALPIGLLDVGVLKYENEWLGFVAQMPD